MLTYIKRQCNLRSAKTFGEKSFELTLLKPSGVEKGRTDPTYLENDKSTEQALLGNYWPVSEMAFKWRFTSGRMMGPPLVVLGFFLNLINLQTKKKKMVSYLSWPPLTKLYGSKHVTGILSSNSYFTKYQFNTCLKQPLK